MDEAIDLLRQYDMHASMGQMVHFAIGDNTGRGVVVEYINNEMVVTETPVVTNFYLAAGLTGETIQTAPLPAFPTLDKAGLLEHFDQLITVPDLTQEELRRFDAEEKADRKPYRGKYHVVHSSGSTGTPGYFLYDEGAWNRMLMGIIRGRCGGCPCRRSSSCWHRSSLLDVFVLLLLVSLSLGTVLTLWTNAGRYVNAELDWAGFGSLTAWVSDVPDLNGLAGEIAPGEVYVSPSLISMFGVELGSEIVFPIARAGGDVSFTVKGFYEDPFMGSSMIGMKGFLICQADHDALAELIRSSGIDALAREGAMLHLFSNSELTPSGLNQTVNENTSLPACAEFVQAPRPSPGLC